MTRSPQALLLLVLLVLGFVSPTAVSALDGLVIDGVVTVDRPSAAISRELKPCQLQGGKRVLPCHPDQGIFAIAAASPAPTAAQAFTVDSDGIREGAVPQPVAPPPRLN